MAHKGVQRVLLCSAGVRSICVLPRYLEAIWQFAGETEADHQELLQFCRDFKFERMGAFAYSEEDGTPAASYPDQVLMQIIFSMYYGKRGLHALFLTTATIDADVPGVQNHQRCVFKRCLR